MYLMDTINEAANITLRQNQTRHPILGIFPIMRRKLEGCPRFLFDEKSIATAVEITLGRPKVLREAMQHLTIPYPTMWVEWPESGRENLRKTFGPEETLIEPGRPLPKHIGFLLEATGPRTGMVTWTWDNEFIKDFDAPNVCPISPFFDLDAQYPQDPYILRNFLAANLSNLWIDNPIQLEFLKNIWTTAIHKPSDWGITFLAEMIDRDPTVKRRIQNFYADVYGEYIMIWSIMMLLTSSRKILDYTPIDNSKWNKARVKQNKTPKLDHTIVTLHINKEIHIHQKGQPLGFARKSPRIHLVGSYLARRGNKHWIVQPYWRGKGEMISRHVHVKA